jgi:hypothetical protein
MDSSVVDRVHEAFLAELEEQGEVDLAESLRPLLEMQALPPASELAGLIVQISEARA